MWCPAKRLKPASLVHTAPARHRKVPAAGGGCWPTANELPSKVPRRSGVVTGRVSANADHLETQASFTGAPSSPPKGPRYSDFFSLNLYSTSIGCGPTMYGTLWTK